MNHLLNKNTRTYIMYGVIGVLAVGVLFCLISIATRPKITVDDSIPLEAAPEHVDISGIEVKKSESAKMEIVNRVRIIEDNVNVRSGPGTEYERLGAAYRNFDFELLSEENNGWIKIMYDDKPAYIYSDFVEIIPMFLNSDGDYEEYIDLN